MFAHISQSRTHNWTWAHPGLSAHYLVKNTWLYAILHSRNLLAAIPLGHEFSTGVKWWRGLMVSLSLFNSSLPQIAKVDGWRRFTWKTFACTWEARDGRNL